MVEFASQAHFARNCSGPEFPQVEKRRSPDGRPIKLSPDPNDHCAGGGSTGGIAAFTLAWERPDLFRRVFSAIGTFVGMRGGDRYPVLVRKTEPKPHSCLSRKTERTISGWAAPRSATGG